MSDSVDMPSGGQIKNSKPLSELSAATAEQVEEEADLVVHHSELPGGLVNFDPQGGGGDTPSSSSESEEDGDNGEGGGYMLLPQEPTELDCEGVEQSSPVSRDTGVHSAIENIATSVSDQSGANTVPENVEAVSNIGEDETEAIKQAMAGFSLPVTAVPEWAKAVPEDVWKAELIDGLKRKA